MRRNEESRWGAIAYKGPIGQLTISGGRGKPPLIEVSLYDNLLETFKP